MKEDNPVLLTVNSLVPPREFVPRYTCNLSSYAWRVLTRTGMFTYWSSSKWQYHLKIDDAKTVLLCIMYSKSLGQADVHIKPYLVSSYKLSSKVKYAFKETELEMTWGWCQTNPPVSLSILSCFVVLIKFVPCSTAQGCSEMQTHCSNSWQEPKREVVTYHVQIHNQVTSQLQNLHME